MSQRTTNLDPGRTFTRFDFTRLRDHETKCREQGFVYCISFKDSALIKIGHTEAWARRINENATTCVASGLWPASVTISADVSLRIAKRAEAQIRSRWRTRRYMNYIDLFQADYEPISRFIADLPVDPNAGWCLCGEGGGRAGRRYRWEWGPQWQRPIHRVYEKELGLWL